MDMHRDETVTAGELYNRAMISKQDLQAEHAGGRRAAGRGCGLWLVCAWSLACSYLSLATWPVHI